jgi:CDP-6-deoxy-D-xylo-4-hexulose-3-dehydrase
MRVPLAVVGLNDLDIENVLKVLRSGKLTMGDNVAKFEIAMSEYLGVNHFIMVNSGSSANLLIFESLLRPLNRKPKLKIGDGVLVPAIAWPTSIWPIIQLGLIPIFVDVTRDTFALDLTSASRAISQSEVPVKAIFPIHPLGFAIDQDELNGFAQENSLILVNDVCESLGSWNRGLHAGTSGIAASFSFYFSHHITTMEGGGIATNDPELADDLRSMRSHGWSRDRLIPVKTDRQLSGPESKFQFVTTGYNVRPTEIQAAIGLGQIQQIDEFIKKRKRLVARVSESLEDTPLRLVVHKEIARNLDAENHSWMMIPICVDENLVSKQKIQNFLEENGIETRPVLTGNFLDQPVIKNLNGFISNVRLDNANWVAKNCFLIGAHHDYSEDQIQYLTQVLSMTRGIK